MTVKKRISIAAAILGHKGGSRNTEAQKEAHKKSIQIARTYLTPEMLKGTPESRRAAQLTIPEEKRRERSSKAGKLRWSKRPAPAMTQEELALLTAGMTAKQIAETFGVSYGKVLSWRRKANLVGINEADAKKIREWHAQQR